MRIIRHWWLGAALFIALVATGLTLSGALQTASTASSSAAAQVAGRFSSGAGSASSPFVGVTVSPPVADLGRYNADAGTPSHWVTTGAVTDTYAGSPGVEEFSLGLLATAPASGFQALYGCQSGSVHFLSHNANCEGATVLRTEGYTSNASSGAFTLAIYRCRVPANNDHFVSTGSTCEGFTSEGPLGFINPRNGLVRYHSTTLHWTSAGSAGSGFTSEGVLGYIASVPGSGGALYECTVGSDHFSSRDAGCEGQHRYGFLGYISSTGSSQALYRCFKSGTHFDTTSSTCEGAGAPEATLGNLLRAPVAVADSGSTNEDSPTTLSVLTNDSNPDGATLTVTAVGATDNGGTVTITGGGSTVQFAPGTDFQTLGTGQTRISHFTYTLTDSRGFASSATVTVTVTGVDDAPVVATSGGSASFTEDGAAVAVDPGVAASDIDSANLQGATVSITGNFASADGDALNFTNQNGITGLYAPGAGVLTLSGSATVANYQAALRSVTYSDTSQNPSTSTRTVSFTVTDTDSAASNTATRSVSVTAVNDAPVVTTSGGSTAYTEGAAAVAVDGALTASDVDSGNLTSASVSITTGFGPGDTLTFSGQNGITGSYNTGTGVLTLSGSATVASYQTALRSITFDTGSDDNPATTVVVSFTVSDGSLGSAAATKNIVVTPVDDAPTLTASGGSASFTEDGGAVAVDPGITAADPDTQIGGATVAITGNFASTEDSLAFTDQNGITGAYNAGTGVLTLSGPASVANYQTALQSITYNNSSQNPSGATRTVSFTVTDTGALPSNTATRTVTVTPVNDAPVVSTSGGSAAYVENAAPVAVDPGVAVSDVDSVNLSGATAAISGNLAAGEDSLVFSDQNGITGTYNTGTGVLTLSGSSSVAHYQTALRSVGYSNSSDNPSGLTRTVSFQVTDSSAAASNVATRTVTVTPVNDAPVVTTSGGNAAYTEGAAATVIDNALTVSDVDSANLASGSVSLTGNFQAGDALGFTNQNGITGSYNGGTGVLTLSGSSSVANYQTALRSVSYASGSNDNPAATKTVSFAVNDGALGSTSATKTLAITPVNDVPTVTTTGGSTAFTEGDPASVIDSGVTVGDPDSANMASATVALTTGFQAGDTLGFTTQNGITGSYNAATGVLSLSGSSSQANYATALSSVTFSSTNDNPPASKTVSFTVNDGSAGSNTATKTLSITAVNDAPTVTTSGGDATWTLAGGPVTVDPAVTVTDPDSTQLSGATVSITGNLQSAEDVLSFTPVGSVTGIYNSGTGVLTLSGTDNLANYQAALQSVTYDDSSGTPNTGARTISFQVTDASSAASNVATRQVLFDHPPVAAAQSPSTNEDTALPITLSATDSDDDALTFSIVSPPTHGALGAIGAPNCAPVNSCTASVTYTPNANYNGADSFTFKANDGVLDSNTAAVSITVNSVNDAPSFTKGADQTVLEDAGPRSVPGWATSISPGPADESGSGQTVTFAVTGDTNASLFSSLPAVSTSGTLTYTPAPNANGSATITLHAHDTGGTANGGVDNSGDQTFVINVTPVNDAPSFTAGSGQTVLEDAGAQSVPGWATAISAGPANESSQTVHFNVTGNTNPSLFSAGPAVSATGTLTYTTAPNANGSASITVTAQDDGGTANGGVDTSAPQSFGISVTAVNDAPGFIKGADQTVLEDAGAQSVSGWATSIAAGPADESGQVVHFNITGNTNPSLFAVAPAVSATGTLSYIPAANANGSATITLNIQDNGTTANGGVDTSAAQTFVINVTAVNDAPSFTKGGDQTVPEDAGAQSVPGWATAISPGPANESSQTVAFNVTNNTNSGLFSAGPAVSPTGTLTYTPAANQNGSATITLNIQDNGGTANGGVDTSATQTFVINVTAVNDPPVAQPKSFIAQANMKETGLTGFLTGVTDADTGVSGCVPTPFSLASVGVTSPAGGTVTITNASTGTVDFTPPPGITGPVTFSYTVSDSGCPGSATSAPATATVTVSGPVIWFVDAAGGNDANSGELDAPFKTLAQAATVDAANHRIFLEAGAYSGPITLNSGEWLSGAGAVATDFDTLMGITPPAGTIARPAINGIKPTDSGSVTLGSGNTVRGLALNGSPALTGASFGTLTTGAGANTDVLLSSAGQGLSLTTGTLAGDFVSITSGGGTNNVLLSGVQTSGTSVLGSGALSGATGDGLSITGQNGSFSYSGTISNSTTRQVSVTSKTGGTVALSGAVSGTGTGIFLNSNTGATINFTGGITLSTGANAAFTATGGGTVNVTQNNTTIVNTLTTTTGIALNIANTAIGASNVTFHAVSANGGANGIVLNTTGVAGGLIIVGDGGAANNGSGGTIQATTSDGVSLTSTANVSLGYINVTNPGLDSIRGTSVNGLTLNRSNLTDNAGAVAADDGLGLSNTSGALVITNDVITNARHQGVTIDNNNVNLASLLMTGSTVTGTVGGDGVLMQMRGTSVLTTGTIGGATAPLANTFSNNSSTGVQVNDVDTGSATLTIQGNAFSGNNAGTDLDVSPTAASLTVSVLSNTFNGQHTTAINLVQATGTTGGGLTATVRGNTVGTAGVLDSGSAIGTGIRVANGGTTIALTIDSNTIREVPNGRGIDVEPQAYVPDLNLKVKIVNNTIVRPTGTNQSIGCGANVPCPSASIFVLSDNNGGGFSHVCSVVSGNSAYDPTSWAAGGEAAYYFARRTTTSNTLTLEGNTGLSPSANVLGNNTVTNSASAPFFDEGAPGMPVVVVAAGTCGSFPP
jgi:hypothetical protein